MGQDGIWWGGMGWMGQDETRLKRATVRDAKGLDGKVRKDTGRRVAERNRTG